MPKFRTTDAKILKDGGQNFELQMPKFWIRNAKILKIKIAKITYVKLYVEY